MLSKLALAGLAAILISGCHSYQPYCNSCGPTPGFAPSQVYQPPSTIVPYQGQPGIPSGGVAPNGVSPNGGSAPPYQPPRSSVNPSGGAGRSVPNYDSDSDTDIEPTSFNNSQYNIESEEFKSAEQPSVELDKIGDSIADERSAAEEQFGEEEFVEPIPFQPASISKTVVSDHPSPPISRPNPYLYDKSADDFNRDGVDEAYEWLRGTIEFDEKHRKWRITYNADPTDQDDKYGGTFTLSNDEGVYKLGLIPDDVVLIEGRVDIEHTDRYGKPTYRVENVQRLEPDPHSGE